MTDKVLTVLVDVADTLVADYDLIDFLHNLVSRVAEVTAAVTVGVVLADELQRLHLMAASNDSAKAVELFQLQASGGPCLDCYRTGTPVTVHDLHAVTDRWPAFAPAAMHHGVKSVHAFPMRLRGNTLGALNAFSSNSRPLEPDEIELIQALADVATISIIQERAVGAARVLTAHLQTALHNRIALEQAKGALAQLLDIDTDAAFELLRRNARRQNRKMADLAQDVIERRVDFATWAARGAHTEPLHPEGPTSATAPMVSWANADRDQGVHCPERWTPSDGFRSARSPDP